MSRFSLFLLISIIITGVLLRVYNFFDLPFVFDELSAMARLNYSTLPELIEKGVKLVDTHPAGIHVFLYYWCKLFGSREWVVKLPFLLMGIGSIYLTFLVAKNWFNQTSALLSAAFISTLQFSITYSTIARPYIPGLFFSLLMVYYWTKYLFIKNNFRDLLLYILSATLCCYIHYFSLLFAGIVGITGLFLLKKANWRAYLLANLSVVILCLPHLGIFLYQMKRGGIGGPDGWLGPPSNDFLLRFIGYIFHYSFLSGGLITIIVLFYFIISRKNPDQKNLFRIICVIWFLLPFLIGFFYSKWENPILQFSILIFSFPYFIFLITSFINESRKWVVAILIILISSCNIYSLIYTRKHYEIMCHQPSDEYAKYIVQLQNSVPGKNVFAILGSTEVPFMEYYETKFNTKFKYHVFQPKEDTPISLYDLLKKNRCDYLVTGFLPEEYNVFFRKEYLKLIHYSEGFTYDIKGFSKDTIGSSLAENILFDKTNNYDLGAPALPWSFDHNMISKDSSSGNIIALDSVHEWGPGFNIPLNEIIPSRNSTLVASIKIRPGKYVKDQILVLQLNKGDSLVHWQGSELSRYFIEGSEWQTIYTSCNMVDLLKSDSDLNELKLNVYFWNKGKGNVKLDDLRIVVKEGNPLIYGLYEPIN
jgi:hypothetical protein